MKSFCRISSTLGALAMAFLFLSHQNQEKKIQWVYPDGNYKALIMSFDDGPIQDLRMVKIFNENHIVGTFNLNSGLWGTSVDWIEKDGSKRIETYIPKDSVLHAYQNHEIAAHGRYHKNFLNLDDLEIINEVKSDVSNLEQLTHKKTESMAYPFGNTNKHIARIVSHLGLSNARTTENTFTFDLPKNYFLWNPTCHISRANLCLDKFLALNDHKLSVFCIWGHSFEFTTPEKWNGMTAFCHSIGNRKDIWYTGSGTFISYLKAVRALDIKKNRITNPKDNKPVWYRYDGILKILEPGQTIRLNEIHEIKTPDSNSATISEKK